MNDNIVLKELTKSFKEIDESSLKKVNYLINKSDRIFVYGTGRSGLMLKAFAMRLMQLGYNSFVVGETITPAIKQGDLLIVASASGSTESVVSMARKCISNNIETVIISANEESEIAKLKEVDIIIRSSDKYSQNKYSIQPMGSLFEQMLLLILDYMAYILYSDKDIEYLQKNHANLEWLHNIRLVRYCLN